MEKIYKMGWLPDYPDFRDYTEDNLNVGEMLKNVGVTKKVKLPSAVDLRKWFSPVEDQGELGSCTANAGVGVVEYYERKAFGKHIDASRLFLYKTTRNILHSKGDTGAFLRTTMQALVLFGVPPEEYWAYDVNKFDKEPSAFCYAFAQNYQTIKYVRLDPPGTSQPDVLVKIKTYLNAGLPPMFGFSVYSSYTQAEKDGKIPFPSPKEKIVGGHAIVAVGYDDNMKIKNNINESETTGALLIRNSWGESWGDKGYGWLPYEYILKGAADDFWVIIKQEWVDTEIFKVE